ncbi:MAG: hypothetical protein HOH74_31580 [Gemmatimonadetes bacterium]|nr:hypothetical protein [Gemmatimonadota bacterium]
MAAEQEGYLSGGARALSHIFSPAGVAVLVLVSLAVRRGLAPEGMLLAIACYVLIPALALFLIGRRDGSQDVYDPSPRTRQRMLMVGTFCYIGGYVVVETLGLNAGLRWAGATFSAGAASVWCIDRVWKISIHNTGAGGGAMLLSGISPDLWPVWCILPIVVGWARWRRGAHDLLQLVAGSFLGGGLAWLLQGQYL